LTVVVRRKILLTFCHLEALSDHHQSRPNCHFFADDKKSKAKKKHQKGASNDEEGEAKKIFFLR
jgi:hypothetical protein